MEIKAIGNQLLANGFRNRASDLYLFPRKGGYQVSFRYHHQKQIYYQFSRKVGEQLIQFFKYLADMDVAEKRRVQVGATSILINKKKQRLRLSTVSNFKNQESLVIRFLHDLKKQADFLTFFPNDLQLLQHRSRRSGLFLFSGATGSGKTSLMYQLALDLSHQGKQVIGIEEPVEIQEAEFLQLQVNPKIGSTYETLIKVCLRHRPDLLIIGEIRDHETAKSVIRGALTGHTIFSTVHALDKYSVVARLLELGISQEELNQCLQGISYQKLLPLACPFCADECSVFCQRRKSAVLLDLWFAEKGAWTEDGKEKTWQKKIEKIWQLGFISDQTYQEN